MKGATRREFLFSGAAAIRPGALFRTDWRAELHRLRIDSGPLTGAYRTMPGGGINWYFANKALYFQVKHTQQRVLEYINLYLRLLDRDTCIATDWSADLSTLQAPDSHDAYAATFLSLASKYVTQAEDAAWFKAAWPHLEAVAERSLLDQRKKNGLIRVYQKPHQRSTAYLMDQCEVYAGLRDVAGALQFFGYREARKYEAASTELAEAIHSRLYDSRRKLWKWSDESQGHEQRWYPELVAQVFPHLCGVNTSRPDRDQERYAHAYTLLEANAPRWWTRLNDAFPWLAIGYYAATCQSETSKARKMLATVTALPRERFTVMDLAYAAEICEAA
jgi:hypothetical protein